MDGVLVNNTQAHVKAFEIFCERYGVEDWQHKLRPLSAWVTTTSCA